MRRAAILLLAAALLSLCLLAGANAALAPAWESADLELEALAGTPEAASGLRLSSRVLYFLPPEPENPPPALASGLAAGGNTYSGAGGALSIE